MKIGFGAIGIKKNIQGSLDFIDIDSFRDGDICLVVDSNKMYFYVMDAYSGENESIPFIVKPKNADGSGFINKLKRWKLISQQNFSTNIIQSIENHITTRSVKVLNDLTIESSSGHEIVFNDDGVTFPLNISGITPSENNQVTTKLYVNIEITLMNNEIGDFIDIAVDYFNVNDRDDIINNELSKIDIKLSNYDYESELQHYFDDLQTGIQGYADTEVNTWQTTTEDNVISYIDYKVEELENTDPPLYTTQIYTSSEWQNLSDELVYIDINHNLNRNEFLVEIWMDGSILCPFNIEKIDNANLRIIMPVESVTIDNEIKVKIFYIEEQT